MAGIVAAVAAPTELSSFGAAADEGGFAAAVAAADAAADGNDNEDTGVDGNESVADEDEEANAGDFGLGAASDIGAVATLAAAAAAACCESGSSDDADNAGGAAKTEARDAVDEKEACAAGMASKAT